MWVLLNVLAVASAQTVVNGSLVAARHHARVPNEREPSVEGWVYGDPKGEVGLVDVAEVGADLYCADVLSDPSTDGGQFAQALAIKFGELSAGQALWTTVTDLDPDVTYRVRFEASLVRHYGQSTGHWRVTFGGQAADAADLGLPTDNPGQLPWVAQTVDGLVPGTETAELRFDAVGSGDGTTASPELPNTPRCPDPSIEEATELLLDGVEVIADADGDGLYADEDAPDCDGDTAADVDGDGLSDAEELILGTDPCLEDTDGDRMTDGDELTLAATYACLDPLVADSDGDGLPDGSEVSPRRSLDIQACPSSTTAVDPVPDSDPCAIDTDGDGLTDREEADAGTVPGDPDSDRDGLGDAEELANGTDPTTCDDSDADGIADGFDDDPSDPCVPSDAAEACASKTEVTLGGGSCGCDGSTGAGPSWLAGLALLLALMARRRGGRSAWLLALVGGTLAACGGPRETATIDTSTPTDTDIPAPTDTDTGTLGPDLSCVDDPLPYTVPATILVSTVGAGDDLAGPWRCSAGNGEEWVFAFTALVESTYVFDTQGSDFDTVLIVLDGCGGSTLACSDDVVAKVDLTSSVDVAMAAGQTVVIVVDSYDEPGNVVLHITQIPSTEVQCADGLDDDRDGRIDCLDADCAKDVACQSECPDLTAGTSPTSVSGTTLGATDDTRGSCDPVGGSSDVSVAFTAPTTGLYGFKLLTSGTDFDAVLYVTDGCGGTELACSDVAGLGGDLVTLKLTAGQTVIAVVDGNGGQSGDFDLFVAEVEDTEGVCDDQVDSDFNGATDCLDGQCRTNATCATTCPEIVLNGPVLGLPIVRSGSNLGKGNAYAGSCGGSDGSETTFSFISPGSADYTFSTAGSTSDTVLYVLSDWRCTSAEVACNDDYSGDVTSQVTLHLGPEQEVAFMIDTAGAEGGPWQLTISN